MTLTFAVTGCGSSSSGHVHFVYKPYKAGDFTPVSSHKLTLVKAGAAGLFAYHEIKTALIDARSSPTLKRLVSPLTALETKLHSLGSGLHTGKLNGGAISQANSAVGSLGSQSSSSGSTIHDLATPSLG